MTNRNIPFTRAHITGMEVENIVKALSGQGLSGDGTFTAKCHAWLEEETRTARALLTHSCTAALEMAALLCDVAAGDEVIMPSFTFVSTANAFVLRGAVPVFVDIRPDTLNIDEEQIEAAITPRTKAIAVVHYAGVSCEMDRIAEIAERHGLRIVEDAAQGLMARYKGRPLGAMGHLGALSFHETKNIVSGEGGALLVNDPELVKRAEIIREKGTDRRQFIRGDVDKYTWQDVGSSYLPSDIIAAFLLGQLENAGVITARRLAIWSRYHDLMEPMEREGLLTRPVVPAECTHNGHIYYVIVNSAEERTELLAALHAMGIRATFHYVPLHDSPAGLRFGRQHGGLGVTTSRASRLVRLPLWIGLEEDEQVRIAEAVRDVLLRRRDRAIG